MSRGFFQKKHQSRPKVESVVGAGRAHTPARLLAMLPAPIVSLYMAICGRHNWGGVQVRIYGEKGSVGGVGG